MSNLVINTCMYCHKAQMMLYRTLVCRLLMKLRVTQTTLKHPKISRNCKIRRLQYIKVKDLRNLLDIHTTDVSVSPKQHIYCSNLGFATSNHRTTAPSEGMVTVACGLHSDHRPATRPTKVFRVDSSPTVRVITYLK